MEQGTDPDLALIVLWRNRPILSGTYEKPAGIALQTADSASGLVSACALVKGGKLCGVTVTTVTKKAKRKIICCPSATGAVSRLLSQS